MTDQTLLIPLTRDPEREAVAQAWQAQGGRALRLDRFWTPDPNLRQERVSLYGPVIFCEVLAQILELELVSPSEDLLVQLEPDLVRRKIQLKTLGEVSRLKRPYFLKPLQPKLFPAGVYRHPKELGEATVGLETSASVLLSEVVEFIAEVRVFVREGEVLDAALYEGQASLESALPFAKSLTRLDGLPSCYVVDLGLMDGRWAVVEFNPAWGAGLNGCSARKVLPAIEGATRAGGASQT